jgi:hypothetical protein
MTKIYTINEMILQSYWWRGINQDINDFWQLNVTIAKRQKINQATKNEFIPIPQCSEPNQRVQMDLFGPLKIH